MSSAFYEAIRKKAGQKFYNVDENELINCMIEDLGNLNSNEEKLIYIKNIIDYCKKQIEDYKNNNQYYEFKNASKEIHIERYKGIYNEPISELEINIGKYNKFVEKIEKTFEKNIKEPEQQERKEEKEMNKFTWNDTEENLIWLFLILKRAGLISENDYKNLGIILQDTFLNRSKNSFKNGQINKVKSVVNDKKKLSKSSNHSIIKLSDEIKKLIPD